MVLNHASLRTEIEIAVRRNDPDRFRHLVAELWAEMPTLQTASFIAGQSRRLTCMAEHQVKRLYFLRSYTVEPMLPMLVANALAYGAWLEIKAGDFNAYAQEILNPSGMLYQFDPDVVISAIQTRDLLPTLWQPEGRAHDRDLFQEVDATCHELQGLLRVFRSYTTAHLIFHSFESPCWPADGIFDAQCLTGQFAAIRELNHRLLGEVRTTRNAYLLDYDALVARHGRFQWHDERLWQSSRLPIRAENFIYMVQEWTKFILPVLNVQPKVLVCDLDNTLWGGVIGEDGMDGIHLGQTAGGYPYLRLQQVIMDLYARGVILAICSKNNPDEAMQVLRNHPNMLLRPEFFGCIRINWNDKAINLREIARELNVGTDSLVFIDDNPAECARIRATLPEVAVMQLTGDPKEFADRLRVSPYFERLALSVEDRRRGAMYAEQRKRVELQQSMPSLEDFYRSLQMRVRIASPSSSTISRIAQLTQRTNQLNLTTRRYSEGQIEALLQDRHWIVAPVSVADRFGDNGIVGLLIVHKKQNEWMIDTLLLSCRVIGRTVETAMLAWLVELAQAEKIPVLKGEFIPTAKNAPAASIYADHHFQLEKDTETCKLWRLDLTPGCLHAPEWLEVTDTWSCHGVET